MFSAGVYEIRNTLNNKVYVGSSINVSKRLQTHRYELKKGIHCSSMNIEKADAIRAAQSEGVVLVTRLAEMFSVSKKVVRSVLAGDTWGAANGT